MRTPFFIQNSLLVLVLSFVTFNFESRAQDWRSADRSSAKLAPRPEDEPRAVVQVYAARTFRWRRYFAVHTWIATKEKNASTYLTYNVIGFRAQRGLNVVVVEEDEPDRRWFGAVPELLRDLRGPEAEEAIPKIIAAAKEYPYQNEYRAWPGPNSNSFVSFIIRRTPEIGVELPPHAIGKDWINNGDLFGVSETRTGFQFSIFGLLGFTFGLGEGIEVNLLGMTFGIDILRPAIKLPFVGRLGMKDKPVFADKDEHELKQDKTQPLIVD